MHYGASWTLLKHYPFNHLPRIPQHIQLDHMSWLTNFFTCKDFLLLCVQQIGEGELSRVFVALQFFWNGMV